MSTKKAASKAKTGASNPVATVPVNASGVPLVLLTVHQLIQTLTTEQVAAGDIRGLNLDGNGADGVIFLGNGAKISLRRRLDGLRVKAYLPDVGGAGASVVYPLATAMADVAALAAKLMKEQPAKAKTEEPASNKEAYEGDE